RPEPTDQETITGSDTHPIQQKERVGNPAAFRDRITAYLRKATREAKVHTRWTEPNADYEAATTKFVESVLDPQVSGAFLDDFGLCQLRTAYFGELNSLSQVLLKCTAPGVPDFYQGSELWDLSLVDPDNRSPVDYVLRRRLLAELELGLKSNDRPALV